MTDPTKPNSPPTFETATIASPTRDGLHTFYCPNCNKIHGSTVDHLEPGKDGWRWTCDHCCRGINVSVGKTPGYVVCGLTNNYCFKTLVLLRLNVPTPEPIHIVVEGIWHVNVDEFDHRDPKVIFAQQLVDRPKKDEYHYNEHTCPWNYLRLPIMVGEDSDPHGIFVHQETIAMPKGYEGSLERLQEAEDRGMTGPDAWAYYFPSLRGPDFQMP